MTELAPISVTVYNRFSHFRRCIEGLRADPLSYKSDLFIYSDAPRPGDEVEVNEIRKFSSRITGFRSVNLRFAHKNDPADNMLRARNEALQIYGKIIRLEDDIFVAPGFLSFMNECLNKYENNNEILNVCGYCFPQLNNISNCDVFRAKRTTAWGIGFWLRTLPYIENEVNISEILQMFNRRESSRDRDLILKLILAYQRGIFAGDLRQSYHQVNENLYTIYPRRSLVQNFGHDGSGLNSRVTFDYIHENLWDKKFGFNIPSNVNDVPDFTRLLLASREIKFSGKLRLKFYEILNRFGVA